MKRETNTIRIHKGFGLKGLLGMLREILQMRNIQDVRISKDGTVTYERMVGEEEVAPVLPDLSDLRPYEVLSRCEPLSVPSANGENILVSVGRLFNAVRMANMHPTAVIVTPDSCVWDYLDGVLGHRVPRDELFSVAVFFDDTLPKESVALCAAAEQGISLSESTCAYITSIGA